MLRHRLVRLAVLVDDQVDLRLLHPQQAQPDMRGQRRCRPCAAEEADDLHPHLDLVRRKIRRFARPFEPVDHQPVHLDRQVPQVEAQSAPARPGRRSRLPARRRLPCPRAAGSRPSSSTTRSRGTPRLPAAAGRRWSRRHHARSCLPCQASWRWRNRRLGSGRVGLLVRAHFGPSVEGCAEPDGALPGSSIRTLPCARSAFSQSSSSPVTCCCSRISWMRSEIVGLSGRRHIVLLIRGSSFFL